jgi:hypothetical protein
MADFLHSLRLAAMAARIDGPSRRCPAPQ